MRIQRLDFVASAGFLVFGIWVLIQAVDYGIISETGPGSGTFPMIAGVFIAAFSAMNLLRGWRKPAINDTGIVADEQHADEAIGLPEAARIAGIIGLIMAYILAFGHLGAFLPLPFLMIGISLVIHWRIDPRWLAALTGISLCFTVACYFIFEVFLRVVLPDGPLGF